MPKTTSAPLINNLPKSTQTYFNIFSEASELQLVDLKHATPLLAGISRPMIILTELHRWNNEANVYYGYITNGGAGSVNVVVKVGDYNSISREAWHYRTMPDLYARVIPVCYGLYGLDVLGMYLGVLVLQRFGSAVEDNFHTMSRVEKTALLNLLLEFHSIGRLHNDLEPSNVLESTICSADMRLIDFIDIELDHECPRATRPNNKTFRFKVEDAEMEEGNFPSVCPRIAEFGREIRYWDNGRVYFGKWAYKVDEVPSLRLMRRLNPINWQRIFDLDVQEILYREWFQYMWKEIQENGTEATLNTALEKLDAWEKINLSRFSRRKRLWNRPLPAHNLPGEQGLVKIPYDPTNDM